MERKETKLGEVSKVSKVKNEVNIKISMEK